MRKREEEIDEQERRIEQLLQDLAQDLNPKLNLNPKSKVMGGVAEPRTVAEPRP
jgi:hypothetical protein